MKYFISCNELFSQIPNNLNTNNKILRIEIILFAIQELDTRNVLFNSDITK